MAWGQWSWEDEGTDEGQVRGGTREHKHQREGHTSVANVRSVSKEKSKPEGMVEFEPGNEGILDHKLSKRTLGLFFCTLRYMPSSFAEGPSHAFCFSLAWELS